MLGPTGCVRVVQIHPSRRCNLRCSHCYSESSPDQQDMLEVELLKRAISDAAAEGYNLISLSGGEPLLYRHTEALLKHTRDTGLRSALVTNGMLLRRRTLDALAGTLDLMVISLDGVPESHNRMRNSAKAFEAMVAHLPGLRESGIPFGFLFTLTQHNLHELPWVVDFAESEGAVMLQIHPLEPTGDAAKNLPESVPDAVESNFAWVLRSKLAARLGERLPLQFDLVHTQALRNQRERVYAHDQTIPTDAAIGDVLSPLVIEPDGCVVPLTYGFPRRFALGNLHDRSLKELARDWLSSRMPEFQALCAATYDELTQLKPGRFVDWYSELGLRAKIDSPVHPLGIASGKQSVWTAPQKAVA